MKRVLVVVLVALLAAGVYFGRQVFDGANADDGLTLYGNVDIREVQMAFRVPGRITAMSYEEGDSVETGDLLATLDDKPQRDAVALAKARIAEAQARVELVTNGARPQEVEQARASVRETQAGLANAQEGLKRQLRLVQQSLSSQRLLDEAQSARDQWQARHAQATEALALAVEGFRREEVAQAQAVLAAAIAQHAQATTALDDTRLLSPSSGTIMTRVLEPGAMVSVGAPVYSVSLTDTVYVRAYVDESNLGHVVPGTEVTVVTDTNASVHTGRVGFVSPRAEFTPKSVETPALRTDLVYRLRIVMTQASSDLRQGMPVTVTIED